MGSGLDNNNTKISYNIFAVIEHIQMFYCDDDDAEAATFSNNDDNDEDDDMETYKRGWNARMVLNIETKTMSYGEYL